MTLLEGLGKVQKDAESRRVCNVPLTQTFTYFLNIIYWWLVVGQQQNKAQCIKDLLCAGYKDNMERGQQLVSKT